MKPGTNAWLSATKKLCDSLEEFGCFVALYDRVPMELENAIFQASDELFDLPTEVKSKNITDKPYHGYVGQIPFIPLHEGMGIDNATDREEVSKFTELMWPNGYDPFRETVHTYSTIMAELDLLVVRMIFENFGIEKHYNSHLASKRYLLRLLKYKVPDTANQAENAFPHHTDKTFLTILHQNNVNGLEIRTKDGEWIGFNLTTYSYVVLAGDVGMGWSNDRIRSCDHRVSMNRTVRTTRSALGLFSFLRGMVIVPEELVDQDHPLKYKPFDNVALIHFYATEEGRKHKYAVKGYCGIEA